MKFKLSDWAEVAEIVASCAVVVSLVFVGLQIRSGSTAAQAASYQNLAALEIGMIHDLAKDAVLADFYFRAMLEPALLDPSEALQASYFQLATFRLWEAFYHQYQSGTLSEDAWRAREPIIQGHIRALSSDDVFSMFGRPFAAYARSVRATQE
jgi:hypothetical protein